MMIRFASALAKVFFTLVAVVCIGASAMFAFEFGWHKGTTETLQWAFALIGAGVDLTKAAMPMWATASRAGGEYGKARMCWLAFAFLTFLSLWCAWGITSIQLAERVGIKVAIQTEQASKLATLDRLKAERKALPSFEFATVDSLKSADDAVAAARGAVEAADRGVQQECTRVGDNCRRRQAEATERRSELATVIATKTKLIRDKATTDQASALDAKITTAELALSKVDVKTGSQEADPQAASMSKATGIEEGRIALFNQIIFAVAIEIGSGLLLWLMYGHGTPQTAPATAPVTTAATEITPEPVYEQTFAQIESPTDSRTKFFRQCVLPSTGQRISGSQLYAAYQKFCAEEGLIPLSVNVFGRNPPLQKERSGGIVWYVNCALVSGYSVSGPVLRVVGGNG